MALREVIALLGFKVDKASENNAKSSVETLKKSVIALGAVVAGTAALITKTVFDVAALGDETAKTSKQLAINAQRLQELQFAANLAGASSGDLQNALRKLQKNANEAAKGSKAFVEDFARLGVTVKDVNGELKSGDQLFGEVADGLKALSSESERVALSQNLLGRAGTKLIPLLTQGSEAINEQAAPARRLGEVMDDDLLRQSEEFVDVQREISGAVQGFKNVLAQALLPVFLQVGRALREMLIDLRGSQGFNTGVRIATSLFKAFAQVTGLVVENIKPLAIAFGIILLLLSPMLVLLFLIGAAIILLIDEFVTMGEGGQTVIGDLINGFNQLLEETGSVADAMAEVFITAFEFWAEKVLGLFGTTLDAIKDEFNEAVDQSLATLSKVGGVFSAGVDAALSFVPGVSVAQAASTLINQPSTTIQVSVDAQGANDPNAVATKTADSVNSVLGNALREANNQLTVSAP